MAVCLIFLFSTLRPVGASATNTGEQISLPATNLPPELTAAAAAQNKNIIWYVHLGLQDAKQMVTFTASYNQAFLRICEGMRCSDQLSSNGVMYTSTEMNSTNTILNDIHYTYVGKAIGGGTSVGGETIGAPYYKARYDDMLLECRFDSYYDFDPLHFSITSNNSSSFTLDYTVLGDINEDGAINSTDAQLALQHSTQQITLTELQKRAADVNEDGLIDATDSLLINQYSVQLISTFWGKYSAPSSLPTTATSGISSLSTYRIQNVYNANGLAPLSSSPSSGAELKQASFSTTDSDQQCVIVYKGSGEYEIRSKNNSSLVWAKSSGNRLILQTRTSSASSAQRWYIIKNSDGSYCLINKAAATKCLTTAGESNNDTITPASVSISQDQIGSRWLLCRDVGRSSWDYFDASFALRYEHYSASSSSVIYNSHPTRLISDAQTAATKTFGALLGVYVSYQSTSPYASLADSCRKGRGLSVTSSSRCISSAAGHQHGTKDGVLLHCTDNPAQCASFQSAYPLPANGANRINTLWSGAYLYREGTTTDLNRSYASFAVNTSTGYLIGPGYIHMINRYTNGLQAVGMTSVYIHEMSHLWGAKDHYHEEVNGVCQSGKEGRCSDPDCDSFKSCTVSNKANRPAACLMNRTSQWTLAGNEQKLFCSYCLAEMREYVANNY